MQYAEMANEFVSAILFVAGTNHSNSNNIHCCEAVKSKRGDRKSFRNGPYWHHRLILDLFHFWTRLDCAIVSGLVTSSNSPKQFDLILQASE